MKMKARIILLAICISLIAGAAWPHGDEEHVIGTVSAITQDSITVKTTASKPVTVAVAPETKFIKDKAAAKLADLAVGDRVVIHAKEITEGNLTADTVEFSTVKGAQAQPPNSPAAGTETLTGVVSDSTCGAAHMMKNMTPADCARACVKISGGYVLVVGTKVYTLKGHEAELDKLAAEAVIVKGAVNGKTITVESVVSAKKG
jgi:hypothetical protein